MKQKIHQMHRDIVFSIPQGIESLAHSPVCSVQGMYASKRLLTVQGHPEFTQEIMEEILDTRHKTGIFDDEAYETHMKKVALEHDGVAVGRAFLRFMSED
jgi:GMP synthase-like glutamine amidotransferase